ncbi:hypothetical protein [Cyanobium sp. NIES-981]|uniref:hypothetical protein n=1 Tax=Cyanobium sp. NIES-981 TaxID=1851505 RepID=UPI000B363A3F|nr:hypothetical protein [Cyanobium sp. NIES-981]
MASSSPTRAVQARPRNRWRGPLLAGFCFGLGYGVTQRLLALQLPGLVQLRQGFDVREFPGTSLESLRLRFGNDTQEIRGDLEVLELERQAKQRQQERREEERKQAEAEQRRQAEQRAEEERRDRESEASAFQPQPGPDSGAEPSEPPEPAATEPPAPALPPPSP